MSAIVKAVHHRPRSFIGERAVLARWLDGGAS